MKGEPEVLEVLSEMLKEELGAINQYMLHAEMCENSGHRRLRDADGLDFFYLCSARYRPLHRRTPSSVA